MARAPYIYVIGGSLLVVTHVAVSLANFISGGGILGETTHEIRHTLCLTQKQFADKYGIPYRTVCGWDSRHTMPDYLYKMFCKYVVPLDILINACDQPGPIDYEAMHQPGEHSDMSP